MRNTLDSQIFDLNSFSLILQARHLLFVKSIANQRELDDKNECSNTVKHIVTSQIFQNFSNHGNDVNVITKIQ